MNDTPALMLLLISVAICGFMIGMNIGSYRVNGETGGPCVASMCKRADDSCQTRGPEQGWICLPKPATSTAPGPSSGS